jgi:hypothetical protein
MLNLPWKSQTHGKYHVPVPVVDAHRNVHL